MSLSMDMKNMTAWNGNEGFRQREGTYNGAKYHQSQFYGGKFWRPSENGRPILCDCRSDTFRLQYGHYEIIATCSYCDHAETVYDG